MGENQSKSIDGRRTYLLFVDENYIEDETNIRYLGIPAGTEFPVLMEALVNVSLRESKLSDETKTFLQTLPEDVLIKIFVTPN